MFTTPAVIAACLVVGIGLVFVLLHLYGLTLPRDHHAAVEAEIALPRDRLWSVIADFAAYPRWWAELRAVEKDLRDGEVIWVATDRRGQKVAYRIIEQNAPAKLVREVASSPSGDLPYGGRWTFELREFSAGGKSATGGPRTRIVVSEDGFVKPAILRSIRHLFFDSRATLVGLVGALERHVTGG